MRRTNNAFKCSHCDARMNDLCTLATHRRPHAELLLLAARSGGQDRHDDQWVELLKHNNLDWSSLLELARVHAVLPSLYLALKSSEWKHVPVPIREQIEDRFRRQAAHSLLLAGELTWIIDACGSRGIPVMPFKGPILAQRLYGNFAQRVFLDLDFLVAPDHAHELCELLRERGYQSCLGVSPCYEQAYFQFTHQLPLVAKDGRASVELHTALLTRKGARWTTLEALSRRAETIEFCGQSISMMSCEELLIFLCLHGEKHCWERLGWICDIARLVDTHTHLDWSWINLRAKELHCVPAVSLGLLLAQDLLGTEMPSRIEPTAGPSVRSLANDTAANLFRPARERRSNLASPFRRLSIHLRSTQLFHDRLGQAWDAIMRPTIADWRFMPLPSKLFVLYYLLRPTRLIGRFALRVFGISQDAADERFVRDR